MRGHLGGVRWVAGANWVFLQALILVLCRVEASSSCVTEHQAHFAVCTAHIRLPVGTTVETYGTGAHAMFNGTISIAAPLSMGSEDLYATYGSALRLAAQLFADFVNAKRLGVRVGESKYALALTFVDDDSSATQVRSEGGREACAGWSMTSETLGPALLGAPSRGVLSSC